MFIPKYKTVSRIAAGFFLRVADGLREKYVMKRNFVEGVAHKLTNGDPTFQDLRDVIFSPLANSLVALKLTPNLVSIIGLIFAFMAAFLVDDPVWFSVFLVLNMLFDGVDGVIARKLNMTSDFGSIVDVTCDTLSLLVVSCGLFLYSSLNGYIFVVYAAVNIAYTFRSAMKSKILDNVFRSIGSRVFAFIGLAAIYFMIASGVAVSAFYVNILFGFIAVLLAIAYFVDILSTRIA